MRIIMSLLAIVLISTTLTGCAKLESAKSNHLHIEPYDLFSGNSQKFKPFLAPMSGAVKLQYQGTKRAMKINMELWQDGKKTKNMGSFGALTEEDRHGERLYEGDFITTMKEFKAISDKKAYYLITVAFTNQKGSISS